MSDSLGWTRRSFLEAIGRVGGAAAVYETMTAMGWLAIPAQFDCPPELPSGHGDLVVIVGAGVAGLIAAYELLNAEYRVMVIEAKSKAGGRSFTVRRNDVIEQIGREPQTCDFDEGRDFYLNAGPGRLPYHHTAILHYCTMLGVPLEVYTMMTRANFFQTSEEWKGEAKANRRIANDTRGWISELLAKAIVRGDAKVKEDLIRMEVADPNELLSLLGAFGNVYPDDYRYYGSLRSGYTVQPGVESCGTPVESLTLPELLKSKFWQNRFYQAEDYEWQPTLFQPVGGMDQIWQSLLDKKIEKGRNRGKTVRQCIEFDSVLTGVENPTNHTNPRMRVSYLRGSTETTVYPQYCISTIPLPILAQLKDNNFSADYMKAIQSVEFVDTCKVGWQTKDRFWETKDEMYGGISYTNHNISQMWYPSWGYFSKKGILTGAYNIGAPAQLMARLSLSDRLELAKKGGEALHPGFANHVEKGLSIAWKQVPHQLGGWAKNWNCDDPNYKRLLKPDGVPGFAQRFWVAGDQVSYLSGWQEGAVRSACHVLRGIAGLEDDRALIEAAPMPAAKQKSFDLQRLLRGLP